MTWFLPADRYSSKKFLFFYSLKLVCATISSLLASAWLLIASCWLLASWRTNTNYQACLLCLSTAAPDHRELNDNIIVHRVFFDTFTLPYWIQAF